MSKNMKSHNSMSNGTSSTELLKSQSHIWNHTFSFVNSASLKCATQLEIPDIIHNHGKPMTLSDLFAALPIHPNKFQHLSRLMRILTHSGFFTMRQVDEKSDEKGYVLTTLSLCLVKNHPMSLVPFFQAMLDPALVRPFDLMSSWFQTDDRSMFETANGRSFWEQAEIEPHLNGFFNKAMSSDARLVASVVLEKCGGIFSGLNSLVDVGGGAGTMAYAIGNAFPDIRCINFDLPHVVAGLEVYGNVEHVAGDMFESVPQADAALLKWILHDWRDEECIKVLMNCKKGIQKENGGNGKVIVIDIVVNSEEKAVDMEEAETETQLFFDMVMMALVTGKERTEKEWSDIFEKSGFKSYKITPVLGLRSVIEVFP